MSGGFGTSDGNERANRFGLAARNDESGLPAIGRKGLAVFALLSLFTTGCAFGHKYEAISGRVVDADTGEPLEGAVVVAVYHVSMVSVGGPVKQYEDAQEAKTDVRGEFTLPEKSLSRFIALGGYEDEPEIYAAKPEYGEYFGQGRHRDYVHPRATARGTKQTLEIALPRLATPAERLRYAEWGPGVPDRPTRGEIDHRKVPYFVELRNKELEAVGLRPHSVSEGKP